MKPGIHITSTIKILSFFFFLFTFLNSNAKGEDSLKNNFDLNDPRNPNCPCHKHQQQANEEYRQFLSMNNKDVPGNSNLVQNFIQVKQQNLNQGSFSGSDRIIKNNTEKSVRHRRIKKIKKHNSWRRMFDVMHEEFGKRNPLMDACFKWQ
ncbi:MAG: hypothetical protein ACXVNM_09975 [Bacteroidia bacterium]